MCVCAYIVTHEQFMCELVYVMCLCVLRNPLFTKWFTYVHTPIPCSFSQNSESVSVCAAVVRYTLLDKPRTGVCTTFLQDRCNVSTRIPVFISTNHDFRLPEKGDVPIIMIGPGTGLAPFRAFIQERSEDFSYPYVHLNHVEHNFYCCL